MTLQPTKDLVHWTYYIMNSWLGRTSKHNTETERDEETPAEDRSHNELGTNSVENISPNDPTEEIHSLDVWTQDLSPNTTTLFP